MRENLGLASQAAASQVDRVDAQKEEVKNPKTKHELRETC